MFRELYKALPSAEEGDGSGMGRSAKRMGGSGVCSYPPESKEGHEAGSILGDSYPTGSGGLEKQGIFNRILSIKIDWKTFSMPK